MIEDICEPGIAFVTPIQKAEENGVDQPQERIDSNVTGVLFAFTPSAVSFSGKQLKELFRKIRFPLLNRDKRAGSCDRT